MINPHEDGASRRLSEVAAPHLVTFGELLFAEKLQWSVKEVWLNVLESGGSQFMHTHANGFITKDVGPAFDQETPVRRIFRLPRNGGAQPCDIGAARSAQLSDAIHIPVKEIGVRVPAADVASAYAWRCFPMLPNRVPKRPVEAIRIWPSVVRYRRGEDRHDGVADLLPFLLSSTAIRSCLGWINQIGLRDYSLSNWLKSRRASVRDSAAEPARPIARRDLASADRRIPGINR